MNKSIKSFYILIFFLIIVTIIITILAIYNYYIQKETIYPNTENLCIVAIDLLPTVSNQCCYIGGTATGSRYVEEINMIVNTIAIPYLDVCIQYCGIEGVNEDKTKCINQENEANQEAFDTCVNISKPINCIGYSMPVAVLGNTYYYPNSAYNEGCEFKTC